MPIFTLMIHVGPTIVARVASLTGLHAGTAHVYGEFPAATQDDAKADLIAKFKRAGLSGWHTSDVMCTKFKSGYDSLESETPA